MFSFTCNSFWSVFLHKLTTKIIIKYLRGRLTIAKYFTFNCFCKIKIPIKLAIDGIDRTYVSINEPYSLGEKKHSAEMRKEKRKRKKGVVRKFRVFGAGCPWRQDSRGELSRVRMSCCEFRLVGKSISSRLCWYFKCCCHSKWQMIRQIPNRSVT